MKSFVNFIIFQIFGLAVLFVTIFFPLYFLLPVLQGGNRILLGVLIAIVVALEIIFYIMISIKTYIKPIKTINEAAKKLALGDYNVQVNLKNVDRELKLLSLNINNLANEFENLEQMRKSFVANASHELRSPLTSIQGFLQAMLDGTIEDGDRNQYLEIVLSETRRLGSLINSMLDLSRLESGATPMNMSVFDVNRLINQITQRFEPSLVKKQIGINCKFESDERRVYADKDKITQVLVNLVDNAIKYSPQNSEIDILTHIHGKKIYISVKDMGEGISKKDQMLIWDRFYMTDKARTPSKNKGTGLGLSIVKRIIEEHKEAIWVESSKGLGATFIFTLPLENSSSKESNHSDNKSDEVSNDIP